MAGEDRARGRARHENASGGEAGGTLCTVFLGDIGCPWIERCAVIEPVRAKKNVSLSDEPTSRCERTALKEMRSCASILRAATFVLCTYAWTHVCTLCAYVCMYVCIQVCKYVCKYVVNNAQFGWLWYIWAKLQPTVTTDHRSMILFALNSGLLMTGFPLLFRGMLLIRLARMLISPCTSSEVTGRAQGYTYRGRGCRSLF